MPIRANQEQEAKLKSALERQAEIYQAGMQGRRPPLPTRLEELERRARAALKPAAYDYVAGGAGGEDTMRANREAFRRWRIVPRMLRNVAQRDLSTELLGARLPAPLLLAPVGVQGILHPEGELATARAAASLGVPCVLSTVSSYSLEQVAEAMGDAPRWSQLYWSRQPDITASLVRRAEAAGYRAVVVTLDTTLLAWRPRDLDNAYLPFLFTDGLANYFSDPVFRGQLKRSPQEDPAAAVRLWTTIFSNPVLTWDDLKWLRQQTRLPIVLKGILHAEDAQRAADHGADAIVVSNHGGRQVDGAIASLDALPRVLEAVQGRMPVLLDSGIRHGADAVKALALGASAVLLGRPYIWGLAVAGEEGVRQVVQDFLADLELTMGLSGYTRVAELQPSALVRE